MRFTLQREVLLKLNRHITGTMVEYYFVCKRKLYYFTKDLTMEHENESVLLGKLLDENTYGRDEKHITIDGIIAIDFIREHRILHEVKKSRSIEEASIWQLKYYIWYLEQRGVSDLHGQIDYPLLRQTVEVELSENDRERLRDITAEIPVICDGKIPARDPLISICRKCSYHDLCFI